MYESSAYLIIIYLTLIYLLFIFCSNHTMALVGPTKKIYSFGRGEEGQLGNRLTTDCSVPLPVLLPHGRKSRSSGLS
jgi:hypothetical protein